MNIEINSLISPIAGLIGVMCSIVTFLITYQKLIKIKEEKVKDLHLRYIAIKELANNIDDNYPEILILLSSITSLNLSKKEVEWFITEPGAFLKLDKYGKLSGRYCKIDLEKGEFSITERISTTKKRVVEKIKIIIFGSVLMSLITTMWGTIIIFAKNTVTAYTGLLFCFIYFLLILWGSNLLWSNINKSLRLQGKPLRR